MAMKPFRRWGGADSFRVVLGFTFAHWRRQRGRVAWISFAIALSTAADVFLPVYAGKLVDAVALGPGQRDAARAAAIHAFAMIFLLGAGMVLMRHLAFLGVIRLTLRMMTDIASDAFHRVQRFSTEWHANAFAGSTVRKVARGMWALDLLNDTILVALMPSLIVLIGSAAVVALYWPAMGVLVIVGAALYVAMTAGLSLAYVAPAARLANQWDTRVGGALADAVSCNAVVKAFGAEEREDLRLGRVLDKWRHRTNRVWLRAPITAPRRSQRWFSSARRSSARR